MSGMEERTFIAIKPDGLQRGLVGEIIKRFEQKGFKLVGMKLIQAPTELLQEHYSDLKERPFFPGLISYMTSGPVVAMVWEGLNVVKTGRVMLGETNPAESNPGTIRGTSAFKSAGISSMAVMLWTVRIQRSIFGLNQKS